MSVAIEDYKSVKAQVIRMSYKRLLKTFSVLKEMKEMIATKGGTYDLFIATSIMLLSTALKTCAMSEICEGLLKDGEGTRSDFEHLIARINLTIFSSIDDLRKSCYELDLHRYESQYHILLCMKDKLEETDEEKD